MSPQIPFRANLDDFLLSLARGDLLDAVGAHYASDARLYENDILVARDKRMVRSTFDELTCDRATGRVRFFCRIDGVDIDGRVVREEVFHAQVWSDGKVAEERQYRGDALARLFALNVAAPRRRGPLLVPSLPASAPAVMAARPLGA